MNADEIVTTLRVIENSERSQRVRYARKQVLEGGGRKNTIHVVYVLTHAQACGGVKVVFEHANGLVRLGARVTVVAHYPRPDWFELAADYVCVPFQYELATGIPPCDVIVATYWDHIHACVERGIAPVAYFEQGDHHLYDWPGNEVPAEVRAIIAKAYELPARIFCVSPAIAAIIAEKYGREAAVFSNALDGAVFYPKAGPPAQRYMLIVGSDSERFKGIDDLKKVYGLLRQRGLDLGLKWITRNPPVSPAGEVAVNPPQQTIGDLYRQATVYVAGSYYEAFPLPPLEAMACGTPVVTTANVGAKAYCRDGVNCLMAEPGDVQGLADRVAALLADGTKYAALQQAGYRTAAAYRWEVILADLLAYYKEVAASAPAAKNGGVDWVRYCAAGDFAKPEDKEAFDALLAHTDADRVLAPVIRNVPGLPPLACWETAARRSRPVSDGSFFKADWPLQDGKKASAWPSADIARLCRQGNYEQADEEARRQLSAADDEVVRAIWLRWVLLCLLRQERDDDALTWAEQAMAAHPLYTDLLYLSAGLMRRRGREKRAMELTERCRLIGDAAFYPEYIPGVAALATADEVAAGAAARLRILVVSWEPYPCHGGVDTYLKLLVGGLRQRGHGVELLSATDIGRLPEAAAGKVRRFIDRLKAEFAGKVPPAIIDIEIKRYAFEQLLTLYEEDSFDIVHSQNGILNPLLRARYPASPLVGTVHGCMYSECFHWGSFTAQEAVLFRDYDRSAVNIPDRVVTVSSFPDKELPPIPAGRHAVVHSGLDVAAFKPRDKANAVVRLVTSGGFTTVKGYDILLAALISLAGEGLRYELTMFGDGYELPGLQKLAVAHALPVVFRGRVAREELVRELPGFDALIQPSRQENFPFAVVEAMAAGCAVVCSRVGGMQEQVRHGENGLLFAAGNAAGLAACLRRVITDRRETARMGRQARLTAEREFSTAAMVEKYEEIYSQLITLTDREGS